MKDLIDRQEAIKLVKELFEYGDCYCDEYSIVGALNGLPPVKHDEWTPCSETDGLPPKAGRYFVTYHPRVWGSTDTDTIRVGLDSFRGKTSWAKNAYQQVIAWMPLHKGYGEE